MAKNKSINLLPQEEFEASILGRVLRWTMGTFRIIVIVTEMIVMGAFLSRFWLDAQNSDLNDAVKVKNAQISAQADFETEFRGLQSKLGIIKTLSQSALTSSRINKIVSKIPGDIILSSMSLDDATTQVKGSSGSELGIAQFITNLKSESTFKTVDIASINSSQDNPSVSLFTIKITH